MFLGENRGVHMEEIDKFEEVKDIEETLLFKNINALCEERNTSVSQMLKDLELPKSTVANWRETRTWMEGLLSISGYFDVSIDSLFSNTYGYKEKYRELEEAVVRNNLTDEDIRVLCGIAKLISTHYR